jgi:predicted RNase H-like HicB family nuclease
MKIVTAHYRQEEDGAWIGTSPQVPGYVAHGDTLAEAKERMSEGLPYFAEQDMFIAHRPAPAAPEEFKRFEDLARKVAVVPKSEVDEKRKAES